MPRRLTDQRRFSKESKMILAAWLGVKFAFGNSTLYDISIDNLVRFFHVRRNTAKAILKLMWEDDELFYVNESKNCVFAKSCRNKTSKRSRRGDLMSCDDVITIPVPECYLRDKDKKESLPLEELVRIIERALVCKEYDNRTGYKYSTGDHNGCVDNCETEVRKTQIYVARRTGLSRAKVGRILREFVKQGVMTKTPAHVVRSRMDERYAFKAMNKETHFYYWAKCEPVTFSWVDDKPFWFKNIIWNAKKRSRSKFLKSTENIKKELLSNPEIKQSTYSIDFQISVERELTRRFLYD